MSTTNHKLKVFLCHASEDKPAVRELYERLNAEGWIDPWLDEEKLLPGQDWDMEIKKAVEAADAVVVFLSSNSINKDGYVQREVKKVLDISDEKPEETIFIVPLRLDGCQPPRRLKKWHYVDFFPKTREDWAFKRLSSSLELCAKKQGVISRKNKISQLDSNDLDKSSNSMSKETSQRESRKKIDLKEINLIGLKDIFAYEIYGQERAKTRILETVESIQVLGMPKGTRPLLTLMFCGPSGVGKTEISKRVSQYVFGRDACQIVGSDYQSNGDINKLIGAPPGYIGYKEGYSGVLGNYFSKQKNGLVLVDELNKADSQVQETLLRILDGEDFEFPSGEKINLGKIMVFAGTNLDGDLDAQAMHLPENRRLDFYKTNLRKMYPSPLLARFDEIIIFDYFKYADLEKISKLKFDIELKSLKKDYGVDLSFILFSKDFYQNFVVNFPIELGVRPIENAVYQIVRSMIRKLGRKGLSETKRRTLKIKDNNVFLDDIDLGLIF